MQKITFEHSTGRAYDDILSFKTDNGLEIKIYFDNCEASELEIDDMASSANSDTLTGIYVRVDFTLLSLAEIVKKAEEQLPAIQMDINQEIADELAMERELSSGRI